MLLPRGLDGSWSGSPTSRSRQLLDTEGDCDGVAAVSSLSVLSFLSPDTKNRHETKTVGVMEALTLRNPIIRE